jgi:hypothetical protein
LKLHPTKQKQKHIQFSILKYLTQQASIETKQMIKPTQKYPSYHAGGLNPSSMILGYFSMLNLMVENGKKKYIE